MLLAALSSCVTAEYEVQPVIPEGLKEVSFRVSVPAVPVTRAIGETEENTIRTIDVLAFRVDDSDPQNVREYFDYYSPGKLQSGAGTKNQTFVAKARIKDNRQRFILIANAREKVEQVVAGALLGTNVLKEDLLALLEYTNPGISSDHKWAANSSSDFTPFPMWGESGALVVTGTTHTIGSISLLRMVAKIDVLLADLDLPDVTARRDFKLSEVHLYNTKDNGRIAPDDDVLDYNDIMELIVTDPTLPDVPATFLGPLSWAVSDDISLTNEIYLPEASAVLLSGDALEATCLVIGGYYSVDEGLTWDSDPTFYRVDFLTTDKTERRPLLRNHRYEVKIVRVIGRGYADKETAFRSKPVNLEAEVLEWNDGGMTHVEFDGTNYLSVNKGEFNLYRTQQLTLLDDKSNLLVVDTDVPGGWELLTIDYEKESLGTGWLNIADLAGDPITSGPEGSTKVVIQTVLANVTGSDRKGFITLKAGRLEYTVTVVQLASAPFYIKLLNEYGEEVKELFFTSGLNSTNPIVPQALFLYYSPGEEKMEVDYTTVGTDDLVDLSAGDVPATISAGTGTGYEEYIIEPIPFDQSEVDSRPFLKKTSRIRFEIEDPVTQKLTAALLYVHQQVANLTVGVNTVEALFTGGTYNIQFSTNADWKVEFGGVSPEVATAVTAVTGTAGMNQNFKFSVPLDLNAASTSFEVIFKSPSGEFPDKTVTVNVAKPALTITPENVTVDCANGIAAGRTTTFTINTNIPLEMLTFAKTGVVTNYTLNSTTKVVTVTVGAATAATQTGTVVVSAGTLSKTFTVTREAITLSLNPASHTLAWNHGGSNAAASGITFAVNTNVPAGDVTVTARSGVVTSATHSNKVVTYAVGAATFSAQSGTITVKAGTQTAVFNVTRGAETPTLALGASQTIARGTGNYTTYVAITSNIPMNQLTPTITDSGNGILSAVSVDQTNRRLIITVTASQTVNRTGTVRVAYGGLTATVNITRTLLPAGTTVIEGIVIDNTNRGPSNAMMAKNACTNAGGRLPTVAEYKTTSGTKANHLVLYPKGPNNLTGVNIAGTVWVTPVTMAGQNYVKFQGGITNYFDLGRESRTADSGSIKEYAWSHPYRCVYP